MQMQMKGRRTAGTAPWPIGVTSIGIHDRSAREKIGHTMNAAHIMNDEATRKYLQVGHGLFVWCIDIFVPLSQFETMNI